MAIIKMQPVKAGTSYGLKAVLDYIENPEKTKNGELVSAKDCLVECAYKQMLLTKFDYKQDTGRQYVHIIQSFAIDDKLTPEIAHEIGQKLLEHFEGFQGVLTTHTDRQHLHNHIVLNSVNWQTGYKWQQTPKDLQKLKAFSDELCREYGLSVIEKEKSTGWKSYGEKKALNENRSWKASLARDVAECVTKSTNRQEFMHYLSKKGIEADFGKNNVMFTLPDGFKCSNEKLMAYGDFSTDNVKQYLNFNDITVKNAFYDGMVMYKTYQIVGSILKPDNPDYLLQKHAKGSDLSGLEGQELVNAILRIKQEEYLEQVRLRNSKTLKENQHPNYFLMTVTDLLELALEERNSILYERNAASRYDLYENEDDEWEYEL